MHNLRQIPLSATSLMATINLLAELNRIVATCLLRTRMSMTEDNFTEDEIGDDWSSSNQPNNEDQDTQEHGK